MVKKISLVILICLALCGCGTKNSLAKGQIENYIYEETKDETNYVKIVVNGDKVVLAELYPDVAPISVANFKKLVKKNAYDNLIFHRVVKDFVVQTGELTTKVDTIKGEFSSNGVKNTLKHDKGILSMARAQDYNSASSQFFICVNDNENIGYLDGEYAAFGKVIAGYENIEEISKVETDVYDKPIEEQTLNSIRFVKLSDN